MRELVSAAKWSKLAWGCPNGGYVPFISLLLIAAAGVKPVPVGESGAIIARKARTLASTGLSVFLPGRQSSSVPA